MKNKFFYYLNRSVVLLAVALMLAGSKEARAQFQFKWMTIGEMQSPYTDGGAIREEQPTLPGIGNAPSFYPAIEHRAGNYRAQGLWVGTTNYTDETGRTFPHKVAHVGPRSGGEIQFFPQLAEVISQFEAPEVLVDGALSFRFFTRVDRVDPGIPSERMIHIVNNNRVGITMDEKVYAWSQEFHDNYHILEYEFTNSGDVDDDPDQELNQPLTGVYFFFINRYSLSENASWVNGNGAPWGKFTMNDAVGDGHEDYGVDFRAQYAWYGHNVFQPDYNVLGGPLWEENADYSNVPPDTTGYLAAAHFVGRVYLHADKSTTDRSDDPEQPRTMGVKGSDDADLVDSEFDNDLMTRQYQNFMQLGRMYPHHADQVEPSGAFDKPTNDPASFQGIYDEGGWANVEGFGPYDMQPGESIHLVIAEAAAGLSPRAKSVIGRAYKRSGANDDLLIPFQYGSQTFEMTKNQWVLTSKDSLFQTFERAIANYNSGFQIPAPPMPPRRFMVNSGTDGINLEWETYPNASQTAWEIWRASATYKNQVDYVLVTTLSGDARSFRDENVQRGIDYYYYIQAVGNINTDNTGNTPTGMPLRSGRYYAQTYLPANLKRQAGSIDQVHIVPNPYNIASDQEIRWPDKQDKLGFLDIPGQCSIKIYTQIGELVDEILHDDGSGDEFWDHTTASRQVIASGIYIAVIEDLSNGQRVFKKFVIIR